MVDINYPWTEGKTRQILNSCEEYDLFWIEEPINPPEDFESLSHLKSGSLIPIAAGESACTSFEFKKISSLANNYGLQVMPHSP